MNIEFPCPQCERWTRTDEIAATAWTCSSCGAVVPAAAPSESTALAVCRLCGNNELYVQKDFPHALGMGILVTAFAASVATYAMYWIWATWVILIGSAAVDVLLYLLVPNSTVCYRCRTRYRGFAPDPKFSPFDPAVGEKYRQERMRRQQLDGP
jgi:hypothetical protein